MQDRKNLFIVHSWDEVDVYERMKHLLERREAGFADYSVPPWKALRGPDEEVEDKIRHRISVASAVVVLNTPGLHKREFSTFEMQVATELGKRIIVLQPHGKYEQPIPRALDGSVYYVAPWRSDVLDRAIRGHYPYQDKVLDIAEQAERRRIVKILASGVALVSFAVLIHEAAGLRRLRRELMTEGIQLSWTAEAIGNIAAYAVGGAAIAGLVTAMLTEDTEAALWAAVMGAIVGGTVATSQMYRAALHGSSALRVVTFAERT